MMDYFINLNSKDMKQKDKRSLLVEIKRLIKRSYEDDGNSYELEFREELEKIVDCWDELVK